LGAIWGQFFKIARKTSKNEAKLLILPRFTGDLNRNESEPLQMYNWRYFYIGGKIY